MKKIWIYILSLLFIFCTGCSFERSNDNIFNGSFSDKKEESAIEPSDSEESTGTEDSSKEESSDDSASSEKEETDKGDSSSEEPPQAGDNEWTGFY